MLHIFVPKEHRPKAVLAAVVLLVLGGALLLL